MLTHAERRGGAVPWHLEADVRGYIRSDFTYQTGLSRLLARISRPGLDPIAHANAGIVGGEVLGVAGDEESADGLRRGPDDGVG